MKTSLCLLALLLALAVSKFSSKKKNRFAKMTKNKHHKETPKGTELNNHFGADSRANSYGPRPELIEHEAYIRNPDGSIVRKHIRQIVHGNVEGSSSTSCDITEKEWYYACMNVKSCDICTASPHCGWCEMTKQCLPEQMKQVACQGGCSNGWAFTHQSCKGEVKSGRFGHWAHDTDHVRTVEYSYPKYKVDTTYTAPTVVRTPVLLGSVESRNSIEKKSAKEGGNGKVFEMTQNSKKPIYGEILQVLPVDVHSTQYIDSRTGQRLDQWTDKNIQMHGTDDFVVNGDLATMSESVSKKLLNRLNQ